MPWTKEMIERATEMAEVDKASATQIAAALGVSRCAVIGKLRRLGKYLSQLNGYSAGRSLGRSRVKKVKKVVQVMGTRRIITTVPIEVKDNPALTALTVRRDKGVSIVDLEERHCRWPHGDEEVWYCGRDKAPNSSYCEGHSYHSYKSSET